MRRTPRSRGCSGAFVVALAVATAALRAEPTFFTARVAPIFEKHCVVCHGAEKHKASLRLDSFENIMHGSESGAVVKPDNLKESELFRRINLLETDDEVMPSDGKPHLSADEIKIIQLWIEAGASVTKPLADFPSAPVPKPARAPYVPLAPDWRPYEKEIVAIEKETGMKLVPRSQIPTDGLILRTASAPGRCDDTALTRLAPVATFIVEAELARTRITDAGLKALGACENLRSLDLTRTAITSEGIVALSGLKKLETINLTDTAVDDSGVDKLKSLPALKRMWLFGTKAAATDVATKVVAK